MVTKNQLLCSFATEETLADVIESIINTYSICYDSIYVLDNVDVPGSLCCTYNVDVSDGSPLRIPDATISLHRKKATNTLYTINCLNQLVLELNNGKLDRNFQIPWENYRNCILVTAYGKIKRINTKLRTIIKISELKKDS